MIYTSLKFQSTPSSRKVTAVRSGRLSPVLNFNPHLPRGRWLTEIFQKGALKWFQSTPSSRKVTKNEFQAYKNIMISIHTFLAEGDLLTEMYNQYTGNFNPHLPRGRWRFRTNFSYWGTMISIHTFLAEGDWCTVDKTSFCVLFQSTPSSRKVTEVDSIES